MRVAIAGAGMAGTSVACALVARGFTGEVVLVDERGESDAARTWCWWDVPHVPFRERAQRQWSRWRIRTPARDVVRGSSRHPYVCLRGSDFYAAAQLRLRYSGVRRVAGERVVELVESLHGTTLVCASGRSIDADVAIDARGAPQAAPGTLVQRFAGRVVQVRDPVFDPGVATLMDFRVSREAPVHFTYVLPFASDTALVEDTVFTTRPADDAARRANVERYVNDILGTAIVASCDEECGALPLVAVAPPRPSRRIAAVGGAGGAIRPSSGYAFVRTQRHARALAEAIVGGTALPAQPERLRHCLLDRALLALLRGGVLDASRFFATLFERSDPNALARFLSDASMSGDDARLLAALLPSTA